MQQSLVDFVAAMDKAGFLVRIKDEVRVDQIPKLMEANPTKAILVEKVKDTEFSVLANAYSNQEMFAWAMGCDKTRTGLEMVARSKGRVKWETVTTAPCKEVILKGDDVDLTRLPLFLHHDRDGHAYTNDNLFISKHPDTGVYDWGIYRSMFRTKNEKSVDMTCTSHRQRIHAMAAAAKGQNLEVAIVLGGPTIDKIAALAGVTADTDDFEVLGAFYGAPAKMIKCETIDVMVPANAEIVLECELMALEGLVYDEGPYGEFTGMYGGGIKHNYRLESQGDDLPQGRHLPALHDRRPAPLVHRQHAAAAGDRGRPVQRTEAGRHRRARGALPAGRPVQHRLCQDPPAGRGRFQAGAGHHADLLQAGTAQDRHGVRHRCRHLGRPGGAVRPGLPLHAGQGHGAARRAQHHDRRSQEHDARASPPRSAWTAPCRWGRNGTPTSSSAAPSPTSAIRRRPQDHDGRGADQGHGGVHRRPAARLARHPEAVSRPALPGALPRVRQPAPQARSHATTRRGTATRSPPRRSPGRPSRSP